LIGRAVASYFSRMISASCHCGAVRLELAEAPKELTECNCSICRRLGTLMTYYHPDQVKISGDETRTYVWGDKMIAFHSCPTCGCATHWTPLGQTSSERMGVNARLMDPEVIAGLRVKLFDGADSWKTIGWSVHPRPMLESA
jgi:hypothetical protein